MFAEALARLPDAHLIAVGSRTQEAADAFGRRFGIPHRHGSYRALAEDDDVDVVYVATPNNLHKDNTLLCLEADKAVLCEKPFAINATEAEAMITTARRRQLFLMDAMHTRFLPSMVRARELIDESVIGDVRMLTADFGCLVSFKAWSRLFDPALGGGALLALGVYPVALASMLFGKPARIQSSVEIGLTGVDEHACMLFEYAEGQAAMLSCSLGLETPHEATIVGTRGQIRIHRPWTRGTTLTVTPSSSLPAASEYKPFAELWRQMRTRTLRYGRAVSRRLPAGRWLQRKLERTPGTNYYLPITGYGHEYEAVEVMGCLRRGRLESEIMPLEETRAIIETMDQLRAAWRVAS